MKELIKYLAFGLLMLAGLGVLANGIGTIKGKVLDPEGQPLPFAHVYTKVGSNIYGAQTDFDGRFTIKPIPPGIYTIMVTFAGYDTTKIEDVQVMGGHFKILQDVHMQYRTFKGAVVYGDVTPLIDPDEPSVQILDAKFLEKMPYTGGNVMQLASAVSSEIKQDEPGGDVYVRGSRSGSVVYFVDGVKTTDGSLAVPGASIGSMRVYTGGVPAMYGDCVGGVIVVETKSYFGSGR